MPDTMSPILLVDAQPRMTSKFRGALSANYWMLTASNGLQALEMVRNTDIHAIIADHRLPEITGVELLRRVCEIKPHTARLLVTTSQDIEHLRNTTNLSHVHRVVSKPVRLTELQSVVAGAMRQSALERKNSSLVEELLDKNRLLERALARVKCHEEALQRKVTDRTRELRVANNKLRALTLSDSLTGLPNHRSLQQSLSTELDRAARYQHCVGLLFIDVDHFKNFNDRNGHQAGNALLCHLGQMLGNTDESPNAPHSGRRSDITSRYGGEEFVVILPETNKFGSTIRAERIRRAVEQYPFVGRHVQPNQRITISIGVSTYPDDAWTKSDLIQAADEALYVAKRQGRNQVQLATPNDGSAGGSAGQTGSGR